MDVLRDESAFASVLEQARQTLEHTGDPEAVMRELRTLGLWQLGSIKVMRQLLGLSLSEAKRLIHLSDAWCDERAATEVLHERLEAEFIAAANTRLQSDLEGILPANLTGFFVGWPNPPSPETLHRMLAQSYRISLAVEEESGRVVGFAQAISDGVLTAFIPLLEVRPEYQHLGLGTEIMRRLLAQLEHLYAVDLSCEEALVPFYQRLGLRRAAAMFRRHSERQNGPADG